MSSILNTVLGTAHVDQGLVPPTSFVISNKPLENEGNSVVSMGVLQPHMFEYQRVSSMRLTMVQYPLAFFVNHYLYLWCPRPALLTDARNIDIDP